ncbi:HPr kinase/phosphorylase [Roseovarius aquimarinus]|uniref:HPr kinase/phosphorylase n=1 Tax=Roseovarius aquimarinus TaxID=1229156 RepID=A0ABW7I6P1_9RHOB
MLPPHDATLHATSVAVDGRAALIRGASGAGKSALALHLIALGAQLVSDDRTLIRREGAQLILDAPETIRGRIEARGVGILTAPSAGPTPAALVVDLTEDMQPRLPPEDEAEILGLRLPLVRGMVAGHFAAAVHLYLRGGRAA